MTRQQPQMSVIVLCLNEAARLPLLLADLQQSRFPLEILISDGGSSDASPQIAELAGGRVISVHPPGRGRQLAIAAGEASGDWLLFLHADSRLAPGWQASVVARLQSANAEDFGWYFDLCIEPSTWARRLLEQLVRLRSRWLQRPYGDQGLLIHRGLYDRCGGFKELPLMEDLDLVERLSKITRLRRVGLLLTTDGRRWDQDGVLRRSWRNAMLRRRWKRGESAEQLACHYSADQLAYQKPQR